MEVKQVTFVTETGKSFDLPSDSRYVSTLLSMYDHTTIPDEIVLRGTVGEVVDREYDSLVRVLARSSILSTFQLSERMIGFVQLNSGNAYNREVAISQDEQLDLIPPIYLHEVIHISRIFDLEDSDYLGVSIDERTPQMDRINCYKAIGRTIRKSNGRTSLRLCASGPLNVLPHRLHTLMKKVLADINGTPMEDEDAELAYSIITVLYTTLLRCRDEHREYVPDHILWDDLVYLTNLSDSEHTRHSDNTLRLYAGKGNLDDIVLTFDRLTQNIRDRQFVLESLVRHLPEDIHPSYLGLGATLGLYFPSCGVTARCHITSYINLVIQDVYAPITLNRLGRKVRAKRLQARLGKYVISRIVLSLQHYEGNHCVREVSYFLRALERVNG